MNYFNKKKRCFSKGERALVHESEFYNSFILKLYETSPILSEPHEPLCQ